MAKQIRCVKKLQSKSRGHIVRRITPYLYYVDSCTSGKNYKVRLNNSRTSATCNCPWGQYRNSENGKISGCSHVMAVMREVEKEKGRVPSFWISPVDAARQRRPTRFIGDGVFVTSRLGA